MEKGGGGGRRGRREEGEEEGGGRGRRGRRKEGEEEGGKREVKIPKSFITHKKKTPLYENLSSQSPLHHYKVNKFMYHNRS